MTTDKNKEQFEKWYVDMQPNNNFMPLHSFYNLIFKMQIGVYLSYYDSLGVEFNVEKETSFKDENYYTGKYICYIYDSLGNGVKYYGIEMKNKHDDLIEAYKEAFKIADELINKQL